MPECKLRYIRATVAVRTCRVPAKAAAAAAAPARWKENNPECWRVFLSQRRAHVRPCRPTRAPSHVTVHRRVWRLRCACTFTRRHCYSAGEAPLKGFIVVQNNKRRFQKLQGFFSCHSGRLMPPCVLQIKTHEASDCRRMIALGSACLLWDLCYFMKIMSKSCWNQKGAFRSEQSCTSAPIRSRGEVKKSNYLI